MDVLRITNKAGDSNYIKHK